MRIGVPVLITLCFATGCGGGDKRLPSSNPPEYDPTKIYTSGPAVPGRSAGPSVPDAPPVPSTTQTPSVQPAEIRSPIRGAQPTPAPELATRILAGGTEGHAALLEALSASGFAALDSKRRVVSVIPQKPEMGIPLEDWEVRFLARAAAEQVTGPFSDFEADVALAVGDEQDARLIIRVLLDKIRAGVSDTAPTVRTWADLIVELGRQSASPYDLLTVTDMTHVQLTALQQVLMLKHLAAEFFALGIERAAVPPTSRLSDPSRYERGQMHLVSERAGVTRRVTSFQPGDPCGFGTDQGIQTSKEASLWGWGLKFAFGPLRQWADEMGLREFYRELSETTDLRSIYNRKEIISSYKATNAELNRYVNSLSKLHNLATALLSLAELVAVTHAVKIDIDLTPPPPLT